jgi:hypothetical protein
MYLQKCFSESIQMYIKIFKYDVQQYQYHKTTTNVSSAVYIIPDPALSSKGSVRRTKPEQQYAVAMLPAAPP